MKKIFLALAVIIGIPLIALSGCKQQPREAADGYTFGKKQYEKQAVQVNVVVLKTDQEMVAELKRRKVPNPENVAAFSVLHAPDFDKCTIYMIDPAVNYQPEFVGHEFLHCVYGQWHTNNNSKS